MKKFSIRAFTITVLTLTLSLAISVHTSRAQGAAGTFFDDFLFDNLGQPRDNLPGSNGGVGTVNAFLLWTVTDGSVDLVGGNVPGATDPAVGGRFVDLGGSTGDPGFFQTNQTITFLPGVSYTFSVRYLSTAAYLNPADVSLNTARATIGSFNFALSTTSPTFQTFTQTFSFPAGATLPLSFQDLGPNDNSGVGIDMVMINPTIVPEPTPLALAVGGLALGAGYGIVRRRLV